MGLETYNMKLATRVGFPIRKSADQSLLAAPRSLSQPVTSFIACHRQGIHLMPFSCLKQNLRIQNKVHNHPFHFTEIAMLSLELSFLMICYIILKKNMRRSQLNSVCMFVIVALHKKHLKAEALQCIKYKRYYSCISSLCHITRCVA